MTIKAEIIDQGPLTDREAEIAKLMVEGHADKSIARLLAISIKTVNAHISNIYLKLQIYKSEAAANTEAINMRCWAVSVLIARRLVSVSVKLMAAVLMFNAAMLDDESVNRHRIRSKVRTRVHMVQSRKVSDA